ncbi:uncharacterized protein LOC119690248 [Teleopsis dalmanni]|uniref:uncharacterized protein LOC119690248 n=1 Tax=Teleopsis dalmanni TaxID=139649 RepID=UPI0018CC952B|nr:uncharacterized protein LOC119690248 [Teleopsis dalmanni]
MGDIERRFYRNKSKLHKSLRTLIHHEGKVQRINCELGRLHAELEENLKKIGKKIGKRARNFKTPARYYDYEREVNVLQDEVVGCKKRVEELVETRKAVMVSSASFVEKLYNHKKQFKNGLDETIDCLKCNAAMAYDPKKIRSYKRRIRDVQHAFKKNVKLTKSIEYKLKTYIDYLKKHDLLIEKDDDPFEPYEWHPPVINEYSTEDDVYVTANEDVYESD